MNSINMRKLWLLFAQTTTVALGVLFIIALFKPDLLRWQPQPHTFTIQQAQQPVGKPISASESFAPAAQKVIPAVVNVFTQQKVSSPTHPALQDPIFRYFFGDRLDARPREVSNLGSGVIVSANGYILTNHHVVEAADQIQVALADGSTLPAKVVGADPETDLAVLKIDRDNLPAITFAQADSLHVGDWVLAVGNPFGVGQTVTAGIVSALGRTRLGLSTFENFIQTDAAVNPGNSGGALVDAEGHLVGINTAIFSRSGGSLGIGFAIPADTARSVLDSLVRHGEVTRGWIGVELRDLTRELAETLGLPVSNGVLITGVFQQGPADKGGLRPGDVVLSIGTQPVASTAQLLTTVTALQPGSETQIGVQRGKQTLEFTVGVAQRPRMERREPR